MHKGIAVSAAALAMAAGSAVPAAAAPSAVRGPDGVSIEIATVNGSGCPRGTAKVALSPDREAFSVSFSDYTARVGGSSSPADIRKNCQMNLKVVVPADYSYAISSLEFRMHASLQPGVKGTAKSSFYFQTDTDTTTTTYNMVGPYEDNFQVVDTVPPEQRKWKTCGQQRNFNINSEVRLDKGTSDSSKVSFVSIGSADSGAVVYHLAWKKC